MSHVKIVPLTESEHSNLGRRLYVIQNNILSMIGWTSARLRLDHDVYRSYSRASELMLRLRIKLDDAVYKQTGNICDVDGEQFYYPSGRVEFLDHMASFEEAYVVSVKCANEIDECAKIIIGAFPVEYYDSLQAVRSILAAKPHDLLYIEQRNEWSKMKVRRIERIAEVERELATKRPTYTE